MHLKPGMKLKGVVVSTNDYAAFVDVGGGVTGILKLENISDILIQNAADILHVGQRINVVVKNMIEIQEELNYHIKNCKEHLNKIF